MHFNIKRCFQITLLVLSTTNCASYMKSRAYDMVDIVTLGVEQKLYGSSIWLSCLGLGLQYGKKSVVFIGWKCYKFRNSIITKCDL